MTRIAFIGVGTMGSRMARRLLDAEHDVVLWNRTPEKLGPLTDRGAKSASSPAEAAREAEVVITMVADPAALGDVTEGPQGVLSGMRSSATLIQMSTVGVEATTRLQSALPEGTGLLDAPVLGSVAEAGSGSLQIFVGGDPSLFERWTALLSVMGKPRHVGPVGAGSAAKLVANSTLFAVLSALAEAMALGERLGLSRQTVFDVLSVTPLAAQAERRRASIESGDYPVRFSLSLARKDADLIRESAAKPDIDLRVAEAARGWLQEAEKQGWGDRDYAAVLAYVLGSNAEK